MKTKAIVTSTVVILLVSVLFAGLATVSAAAPAGAAAPSWNVTTVASGVGPSTSIAVDAAGHPHIAYDDRGQNAVMYAWYDGTQWHTQAVQSDLSQGQIVSLALDSAGNPHIAYATLGQRPLNYSWYDTSGWHEKTVADQAVPGCLSLALKSASEYYIVYGGSRFSPVAQQGLYLVTKDTDSHTGYEITDSKISTCSIAIDSARNGIHVAYCAAGQMKYSWADASGWHTKAINPTGTQDEALSCSIAVDSAGNPHIAFPTLSEDGALEYVWADAQGWYTVMVDTSPLDRPMDVSLALDAAGNAHIAYDNMMNLNYAWYDTSGWHIQTVAGRSDWPLVCSLALDSAGQPHISFLDLLTHDLKYAVGTNSANTPTKQTVLQDIARLRSTVSALPASSFKPGTKVATLAVISAAEVAVRGGSYGGAAMTLKAGLLARTDGCAKHGKPDSNDWVRTCAAQGQLYPQVQNLIQELGALQGL